MSSGRKRPLEVRGSCYCSGDCACDDIAAKEFRKVIDCRSAIDRLPQRSRSNAGDCFTSDANSRDSLSTASLDHSDGGGPCAQELCAYDACDDRGAACLDRGPKAAVVASCVLSPRQRLCAYPWRRRKCTACVLRRRAGNRHSRRVRCSSPACRLLRPAERSSRRLRDSRPGTLPCAILLRMKPRHSSYWSLGTSRTCPS